MAINRVKRSQLLVFCASLCVLSSTAVLAADASVLFVLDGSGSMQAKLSGRRKIEAARTAMDSLLKSLPGNVQIGLATYGRNRKDDCNDIELVAPMGSDRRALIKAMNSIDPKGMTPLTESIRLAAAQLREHEGAASVVVVSDGKETCAGDPCAAARDAVAGGVELQIHVVGFDVTPEEAEQLQCVAREGKGKYFPAANAQELGKALAQVKKEVIPPPAPPKPKKQVLFEDKFERDDVGEMYEIRNPDPNRLAVSGGKLVTAATLRPGDSQVPPNLVLLQQTFPGDFVVTLTMNGQLAKGVRAGLFYWVDDQNFVFVGPWGRVVAGGGGGGLMVPQILVPRPKARGPSRIEEDEQRDYDARDCRYSSCSLWRCPAFSKVLGGKWDDMLVREEEIGGRKLIGEAPPSEIWYIQIERDGPTYIGRISVDGAKWTTIGSQVIPKKNGKIGVGAYLDWKGSNEHAIEFSNLVVQGPE